MTTGRRPKIAAPPGHKGCPKCEKVLPLKDPVSGETNFVSSGYCRLCSRVIMAERRRRLRNESGPATPTRVTPGLDFTQIAYKSELLSLAKITPFPKLAFEPLPACACCGTTPTQTVHGKSFCDRCGYYVSACGRCVDHSNREHIKELLHHNDPPLLPPFVAPIVEPYAVPTVDRDELDVPPDTIIGRTG